MNNHNIIKNKKLKCSKIHKHSHNNDITHEDIKIEDSSSFSESSKLYYVVGGILLLFFLTSEKKK